MALFSDLLKRPGIVRYAKNLSWMFFARLFTMGVSFLTTLYIARTLGPTNFGELDYALAIIGMFAPLAAFGIINVLQRELIKHPERESELTGTAFVINLGFSVLAMTLALAFAFLSPVDSVSKILILVLSTTYTLSVFQLLQQHFYARAESKVPSLITMGVWTLTSLSKVAVLLVGKGVIWLAAVSVLEQILYAAAFLLAYRMYVKQSFSSWRFAPDLVPIMLKTGAATAFVGFSAIIYARIDQIFIRHMIDAEAVGLYSAGVRLVELWNILPALLLGGLYPALLHARNSSEELYRGRMKKLLFVLTVSGLALAASMSLAAPLLMKYIFGPEFLGGTTALQIYSWSILGTFIGQYVMNILFTDDYRKVLIATNLIPAIVNILLNLLLIPTWGILGAAYATVIAYTATPLVPFCFSRARKRLLELM